MTATIPTSGIRHEIPVMTYQKATGREVPVAVMAYCFGACFAAHKAVESDPKRPWAVTLTGGPKMGYSVTTRMRRTEAFAVARVMAADPVLCQAARDGTLTDHALWPRIAHILNTNRAPGDPIFHE